jgi:hypothetical protein
VDTNTRAQIRTTLVHFDDISRRTFDEQLKAIYADHAAKGLLKSGATVKRALRTMEEFAGLLITDSVDRVAAVSKEPEAFAMIRETVHNYLSYLYDKVETIAEKAGGRRDAAGLRDSILKAADDRFGEARKRLERQLEIYRFTFTIPTTPALANPDIGQPAATASPLPINKGGRLPAAFWDDVWAAIAMQLYDGDLKPKSQAEIERAMAQLINDANFSASTATVRDRARKLWVRWQASLD